MPPKPAPKLTKKQLAEQKKQEERKREEEQKEQKRIEEQRQAEQRRLQQIEAEKRRQQQRARINEERQKYQPQLSKKLKQQAKIQRQTIQAQQWEKFTKQFYKDYDISQPKLSTAISIFRQSPFSNSQKILKQCQDGQIYVQKLNQSLLRYRSAYDQKKQAECEKAISQFHQIQMKKLQQIMIYMANSAQEMQQKNSQMLKNKSDQNTTRKSDGQKLLEYKHYMSDNFKIGMFLNSTTTKQNNKFKPIEIKEFGLNTEIPSKWINANTIVKFEWVNFNPYPQQSNDQFMIIGGVYNLEFYQLLLGSKKISSFVLKKSFKGKEILQKFKLPTAVVKEPFQVRYQIPKHIFLTPMTKQTLRIAQYDFSTSKWTALPNQCIIQYEEPQKRITCRISRPQPIAYIQDICTSFPYVAWQLRTIQPGNVYLDIQLKRRFLNDTLSEDQCPRMMLKFDIQPNQVKLIIDGKYPELEDLCSSYQTPESLLQKLSERGIHLLPRDQDYEYAKIPVKNRVSEKNAIRDIAYAVQSYYFRSEPNQQNNINVKIRENLDYDNVFLEDQEKDWKKVSWGEGDRCWITNRDILDRHLNFEMLLQNHQISPSQCIDRIKYDRNYLLRKTIMKMLELTRILSFICSEDQKSQLIKTLRQKQLIK